MILLENTLKLFLTSAHQNDLKKKKLNFKKTQFQHRSLSIT